MNHLRSARMSAAFLGVVVLTLACTAPDEPSPPPAPTPMTSMPPQLEMVVHQLQDAPPGGAAAAAARLRAQLGALADRIFVGFLDGREEVPANDSQAVAIMALLVTNPAAGQVVVALAHNVMNASAAHIHRAPGGQNGPIIVPLDHSRFLSIAQATLTTDQLADLQAGRHYGNVHSTAFPRGEIRGQLLHLGESLFTSMLSGANEVPVRPSTGTGALAVILDADRASVRYEGVFTNLTTPVTVAHIHVGATGMNGPVRIPLTIVGTGPSGTLAGTAPITADDVAALEAGNLYTNVHSMMFPAGEIRDQLTQK